MLARVLRAGLLAMLSGMPALASEISPAAPATTRFEIDLRVPEALREMLERNLDIYRWRHDTEAADATRPRFLSDAATRQIRALLETEGHYTPRIAAEFDSSTTPPSLTLEVEPGPRVRVRAVEIVVRGAVGIDNPALADAARQDWRLPAGKAFRHADWEAAKRAALLPLLIDAYPAARIVASAARVDARRDSVDLHLEIDSGDTHRFGVIEIEGLQRYPRKLVERLNPIEPGALHSQRALLDFQARLRDSPYFASATVSAALAANLPHSTPVRVHVEERKSRRLAFGVGVSTDAGPRASLEYRDLNLLDRALRLSTTLVLDPKRQDLGATLERALTRRGHRDSLHMRLERSDAEGLVTRLNGVGIKRAKTAGRLERVINLEYLGERQSLDGAPGARNQTVHGSHAWIWRDLDHALFPSAGYLFSLNLGLGAQVLASDQDFLRAHGRLIWFQPLGANNGLILRGELGAVFAQSRMGIPDDLLFRAGGDQSLRGYAYQSLGVRQGNATVGGRYLALGGIEFLHWFRPQWGIGVFVDAGDAADQPADLKFRQGYGLGARWKSPVGPLNLDIAHGRDGGETRLHFHTSLVF